MKIIGDESFTVKTSDGDIQVLADCWDIITEDKTIHGSIKNLERQNVKDYEPGYYGFKYGCLEYLVHADTLEKCAECLAKRLKINQPYVCIVTMYQAMTSLGYCRMCPATHSSGRRNGKWGTGHGLESAPYVVIGNMPTREECILAWYEAKKAIHRFSTK